MKLQSLSKDKASNLIFTSREKSLHVNKGKTPYTQTTKSHCYSPFLRGSSFFALLDKCNVITKLAKITFKKLNDRNYFDEVNVVQAGGYQVRGNRQGQVTVREITSFEVIGTFEIDEGVVVREVFLLDGSKTIAACQKDHAIFWHLATGEQIYRFPKRIYGFSNNDHCCCQLSGFFEGDARFS